jgi:hypothetical protein
MTYRILSLDGGGAWALVEVRALIDLYGRDKRGNDVLAQFDLVAANSGGSIVLGGLAENLTLGELEGYFSDEAKRRSIFSPTRSPAQKVLYDLTGLGPRYDTAAKLPALRALMPQTCDMPLAQAVHGITGPAGEPVRLLIVGFDYDRNLAVFFRSTPSGGPQWGSGAAAAVTLAQAIHASTNAPVAYFDAPASFPGQPNRYWDGGITGNNNPVLAAVAEAIMIGRRADEIIALSLGTGGVRLPLPRDPAAPTVYELAPGQPSLAADLQKLATSVLDDPPDAATFLAHLMTAAGAGLPAPLASRIVRMNPLVAPVIAQSGLWVPPQGMTADQFVYLKNLDMDAVLPEQVAAIAGFAELWLADHVRNQPIRIDSKSLHCELGHEAYSDAKRAWLQLTS